MVAFEAIGGVPQGVSPWRAVREQGATLETPLVEIMTRAQKSLIRET
jgi:hypothetical protein